MLRNEKFAYKLGTRIQTKDLFGVKQQCYPLLHRAVGFNPLQFFLVFFLSENVVGLSHYAPFGYCH